MKKVIVISGPSGVGKTTMYKKILEQYRDDIAFSVSATTRQKRDGEVDGKDYHFLSMEKFESLLSEDAFIEWEQVHNNYYGTLKSEVTRIWNEGKHCLLDIDVKGGLNIQRSFKERAYLIFVSPPSIEDLETRLRSRKANDEESLRRRLDNAIQEMTQAPYYDFELKNGDLDIAIEDLKQVIKKIL